MGNRKIKTGSGVLPVWRLMGTGFLLGILIPNVIWKLEWRQNIFTSVYLLCTFRNESLSGYDYLLYVLKMRGSVFLVIALCGLSVFGVPLSVLVPLIQGIEAGMVLTMSVLQFGLAGGIMGAGLLLPQYLLYIPAICYLLSAVYFQSMEIWRNKGLFPQKIYGYAIHVFLAGAVYTAGIFLEVYCNPLVFQMFTKNSYFL